MTLELPTLTYLVRDYDEAIRWFTDNLGFALIEDTPLTQDKRWVRMAPNANGHPSLLLAKADTPEQDAAVGNVTGGRVGFFLHTANFQDSYMQMRKAGVLFKEKPRTEPYGIVAVFEDLYGNKWDLIEPARPVNKPSSPPAL